MLIKTWRDPYDAGFSPTTPKEIELHTGVTVLVGCNGAGKTTLLQNIKDHCSKNNIPCHLYNNLNEGGFNSISELFYNHDYAEGAFLMSASEGECIKANLGRNSSLYKNFFQNGIIDNRKNRLTMLFNENADKLSSTLKNSKDRVLLFDAVDSGLSVDSIIEVKAMFDNIIKDVENYKVNIYIIIAANEYELARNSDCFDVNSGKYLRFSDYEDYRSFIIKSRVKKETRIGRQTIWREKQHTKEIEQYKKLVDKYKEKRKSFLANIKDLNNLSCGERWQLRDLIRPVEDFERSSRFITSEDINKIKGDIKDD